MRPWWLTSVLCVGVAAGACGGRGNAGTCFEDADCSRGGVVGRCVSNVCAFPSEECDSGWKLESGECDENAADTGVSSESMGDGSSDTTMMSDEGPDESGADEGLTTIDPEMDLPASPTCGPEVGGCDKVDILIVMDDSASAAADEWEDFVFASGVMTEVLPSLVGLSCDAHVGVTTTGSAPNGQGAECSFRGALRRRTSLSSDCWDGEPPFLTDDSQINRLICALGPSDSGDPDEHQVGALLGALEPDADGCNDGFFREDAKLVVLMFTDEDDDDDSGKPLENGRTGTPGDPTEWVETLAQYKNLGSVGIVLIAPVGAGCEPFVAKLGNMDGEIGTAEHAARLLEITAALGPSERVVVLDLCGGNDALVTQLQDVAENLRQVCGE